MLGVRDLAFTATPSIQNRKEKWPGDGPAMT
jgi:hypothetical protein